MKTKVTYLLLLFLLIGFCTPKESDYQNRYAGVVLLQLVNSTSDANATCISVLKKQNECLSARAVDLGFPFTQTADSILETTCNDFRKTAAFNNMSNIAQTCIFTCQDNDWKTKIASTECKTATTISLLISNADNTVLRACTRACFQTTNAQLSDADLNKYLIFGFIQKGD